MDLGAEWGVREDGGGGSRWVETVMWWWWVGDGGCARWLGFVRSLLRMFIRRIVATSSATSARFGGCHSPVILLKFGAISAGVLVLLLFYFVSGGFWCFRRCLVMVERWRW